MQTARCAGGLAPTANVSVEHWGGVTRSGKDAVSPPNPRRHNMRANRRRDTMPERALRSALHAAGLRYRCDLRLDLSSGRRVRPDIVFTRAKVAVFVDGCFWHCCPEHGHQPRTNTTYWQPKLARNRWRDQEDVEALEQAGWLVLRVWEHVGVEEAAMLVVAAVSTASRRLPQAEPS